MKSLYKSLFFALTVSAALTYTACTDEAPGEELTPPEMTNNGAINIARTTCTVSGKYSGNLTKISEYGVKYSTSNNFPTDATTILSFSGQPTATVSAELEDLSPNTQYYYCWYASTGESVVTSAYGEFTTTSTSKPQFTEITIDSIGENYMLLRCRVVEIGDQYLVEQGISYRAKSNAAASFTQMAAKEIDSNNEFTVEFNDLTAATTYEVRPYAKNSSDAEGESGMLEGYGETQTVTTENKLSPELETYDATDVSMNSARVLAMVTAAEGSYGVITERGFCYSSTSQNPTIYDQTVVVDGIALNEVYEATITDLDQLTTYYVRPYAKNLVNWQERVGYGSAIEFTTTQFTSPQVSFTNQSDVKITASTLYLQAQIENYYPTALVERGFIWSTDDGKISIENAKSMGNYVTVNSTDKVFFATLQDLQPQTKYYVRAYAIYQVSGESFSGVSDVLSYTTNAVSYATFRSLTCTSQTFNSLTVTTGISEIGDGDLEEKGFMWRKGTNGTITFDNCEGTQIVQDEDNYNFSATISDLESGTGYLFRAYAKTVFNGETKISYSDALYCATNDLTPLGITWVTALSDDYIELSISCDENYADKLTEWSAAIIKEGNEEVASDDISYTSAVEDASTNKYVVKFTGLKINTTYVIRIRAKYNNEYYIYQDTGNISSLKGPNEDDIDDPTIK
jgi:hypothetical protein